MRVLYVVLAAVWAPLLAGADEPVSVFGGESARPPSAVPPPSPSAGPAEDEAEGAPVDRPAEAVWQERLSPLAQVSQLMFVTPQGRIRPSMEDFAHFKDMPPGGVVIPQVFKVSSAAAYVSRLRELERGTGVPLWIGANLYALSATDRTGQSNYLQLPTMLSLGAAHDAELARDVAVIMADHMKAMGFDFYMGPSLALAPSVGGAAGSLQSFGADPVWVGETGVAMLDVLRGRDILPMPMNFPGGDCNANPRVPSVLLTPMTSLQQRDLAPFRAAIDAGTEIVHVGPALVPTVDPMSPPACLSPAVMRGMLRDELGFTGVIVAGPLDAPVVKKQYAAEQAGVMALKAGADMLYWGSSGTLVAKVVSSIGKALDAGDLEPGQLEEKLERVLALKASHRAPREAAAKAEKLDRLSDKKAYRETVKAVERRSITLVKNAGGVLPLGKGKSMPLLVTGTTGARAMKENLEAHFKHVAMRRITTARHIGRIEEFEIARLTDHIRGVRTIVCILHNDGAAPPQAKLVRGLQETGARVVVVLLGYPGNLPALGFADAILLAYTEDNTIDLTLDAMADVLVGQGPVTIAHVKDRPRVPVDNERLFSVWDLVRAPTGRLPLHVNEAFPLGHGVHYAAPELVRKATWFFEGGKKRKELRTTHAFQEAGVHTVTLEVEDQQKNSVRRSFEVEAVAGE